MSTCVRVCVHNGPVKSSLDERFLRRASRGHFLGVRDEVGWNCHYFRLMRIKIYYAIHNDIHTVSDLLR